MMGALAATLLATGHGTDPAFLARLSTRVAVVRVLDARTELKEGPPRQLLTTTRLAVEQNLVGAGPKTVEVTQLGGRSGDLEMHVNGDASFAPSERAVVFLKCVDAAHADRCNLIGLSDGKLALDAKSGRVMTPSGPRELKTFASDMQRAHQARDARRPTAASNGDKR